MSEGISSVNIAAQWAYVEEIRRCLYAELARRESDDAASVELYLIDRERYLGLFNENLEMLPEAIRVAVVLLIAELHSHSVLFVDYRIDPLAFAGAFALGARVGHINLSARGPMVCLSGKPAVPAEGN